MMNEADALSARRSADGTLAFSSKLSSTIMVIASISALAACATQSNGSPASMTSPTSRGQQANSAPDKGAFDGLKACDLLEPITSEKGFGPAAPETYQSDNGCRANKPRYGTATTYLVENAGISDLKSDGGQSTETSVAGKKAVEIAGGGGKGNCLIGISVTESSRATVSVTLSSGTNEQSCADAKAIAEQIAPKLPQGN
ncbi:DUF3558 family protein [Amycolatopsis sp. cmx-11-12]|uniref:DUF3558 family protein n=1 Tax=Amycolatopsis sp. cmx-11-12 TaxID=2785795 RepID=UPI003918563C